MEEFYPTLEVFLSDKRWISSSYLSHPEFSDLYVRKGVRVVHMQDGSKSSFTTLLQLARVTAVTPKNGALRRLIQEIDRLSDCKLPIYIENLYNEEAVEGLLSSTLGFQLVDEGVGCGPCLLRLPQS